MTLPSTAGTYHGLNYFGYVIYTLQTNMYQINLSYLVVGHLYIEFFCYIVYVPEEIAFGFRDLI